MDYSEHSVHECVWEEVGKRAALQLKEVCTEVKFSW